MGVTGNYVYPSKVLMQKNHGSTGDNTYVGLSTTGYTVLSGYANGNYIQNTGNNVGLFVGSRDYSARIRTKGTFDASKYNYIIFSSLSGNNIATWGYGSEIMTVFLSTNATASSGTTLFTTQNYSRSQIKVDISNVTGSNYIFFKWDLQGYDDSYSWLTLDNVTVSNT